MLKYLKLSFLIVFLSETLFAQQSSIYTHDLTEFNRAVELYKDKQYEDRQFLFQYAEKSSYRYFQKQCHYSFSVFR